MRAFLKYAAIAAIAILAVHPARAQSVIEDWASVKVPAAPELKPATVDPKTTALLVLDLLKQSCNDQRPRCLASLPSVAKLLADARSHGSTVIYSTFPGTTMADTLKEVAPTGNEPSVNAPANKFTNPELDKILKDKGIKTVIVVGTVANGAVLYTASDAAMRGYKVIVPIEGMSAPNLYQEQFTAWNLANGPTISANTTLTKISMIGY
jgi:nicotinamidase-related amidase